MVKNSGKTKSEKTGTGPIMGRVMRISNSRQAFAASVILAAVTSSLSLIGAYFAMLHVATPTVEVLLACAVILPFSLIMSSSYFLLRGMARLQQHNSHLARAAECDDLTHLANRAAFSRQGHDMLHAARESERDLSLILLDADYFKAINDEYGHLAGDFVLQHIAEIFRNSTRAGDLVARWGGEEFAILLPGANMQGAEIFADRVRRTIAQSPLFWNGKHLSVTVSAGVAQLEVTDATLGHLLQRADMALYKAKESGRNCVEKLAQQDPTDTMPVSEKRSEPNAPDTVNEAAA